MKIGYVSPDFRDHVVGRNLLPLFRQHDHQRFEIVCYADVAAPRCFHRALPRSFRRLARYGRSERRADSPQCIREDGIDILVDLTLHMARNRLLVFARKPAPVQVTFAGYPGTTGLRCHRLPHYRSAPGPARTVRPLLLGGIDPLAGLLLVLRSARQRPAVNALPAAEKGHITFGCLNNFCKVNPPVSEALGAGSQGRRSLAADRSWPAKERIASDTLDLLAEEGVAGDRVTFVAQQPRPQYLSYYHGIDIGLDTVPYNGHTTSLDSFWMGVPVVTLVGPTVVGRAGLCQLMNLGLPELIAASPEQYVRIAAELARDLPRLSRSAGDAAPADAGLPA